MNNLLRPLKVVAINGSPRPRGNTFSLIKKMFEVFQKSDVETELVNIGNKNIKGCRACMKCLELGNYKCVIDDDIVNETIQKLVKADGIILATPVYCAGPSGQMKCFMDRVSIVNFLNVKHLNQKGYLNGKVGAGISVHRRGGAVNTQSQLNYFFSSNGTIIPGSTYWNFATGMEPGDVKDDQEGMNNMTDLAKNMIYLMNLVRNDQKKKEKYY
ncbi:nad(p)h-dependent fmn-containing oxidoreductase ywqn-related [Anaeramoeba flamelloides]|uniref:Nad(P)h-dependent fmn-containing oxidoreductase ywqn-related n=1 Tax=Anaeramoeba flamelloides TaxID=1746091 RepID=A0AAV7Z1W6_9EUKA|nr:nad(p)h-dependent fmn-containing oxidoreductase ywqn-related [Anaeramoeba flamelloides]